MATKAKTRQEIAELRRRRAAAEEGGGAARREREYKAGKLMARERIDLLLDEGTFEELDKFVDCLRIPLEDVARIEVGPMNIALNMLGVAKAKATCIRVYFK